MVAPAARHMVKECNPRFCGTENGVLRNVTSLNKAGDAEGIGKQKPGIPSKLYSIGMVYSHKGNLFGRKSSRGKSGKLPLGETVPEKPVCQARGIFSLKYKASKELRLIATAREFLAPSSGIMLEMERTGSSPLIISEHGHHHQTHGTASIPSPGTEPPRTLSPGKGYWLRMFTNCGIYALEDCKHHSMYSSSEGMNELSRSNILISTQLFILVIHSCKGVPKHLINTEQQLLDHVRIWTPAGEEDLLNSVPEGYYANNQEPY
ncbi:hypothetical protein DUI87_31788 [Hirundo rustica rustica]|uniref:Uncharacterized protein n=1 Tax=Hirundo rustica rustica TaxID=333673 RepID=A0A3M0IYI3_HIRRU|nr:hypothetical protein DUI87_31788 [Hirundo rustica rustica]